MKFSWLLLWFPLVCLPGFHAVAVLPDTVYFTQDFSNQHLKDRGQQIFTQPSATLQEVHAMPEKAWQPFSREESIPPGKSLWIRFFIKNLNPNDSLLFFNSNNLDLIVFHVLSEDQIKSQKSGLLVKRTAFNPDEGLGYVNFPLPFLSIAQIYVEIKPVTGTFPFLQIMPMKPIVPRFSFGNKAKRDYQLTRYFETQVYELQVRNLYQGALFLVGLVSLFFLIQNRGQRIYLYYFLYAHSALMYSLLQSRGYTYIGQFLQEWPYLKKFGGEICLWLGIAAYFGFASELLDIPRQKPVLFDRIRKIMLGGIAFSLVYYVYQWGHNDNLFQDWVKLYSRIPLIIFYLWFFWYVLTYVKSPFLKYIVLGNAFLLVLACVAWIKDILHGPAWPGILNNLFTLPLAVLTEIVVFSFALVMKQKLSDNEKNEMERVIAETEMLALRSQMNPHFIFNSLSSIRNLIIKDEKEKAIDYLSRFSKLVRLILQQTRKKTISLEEELDLLKLYVRSESDRLEKPIRFILETDEEIAPEEISFPPMLLQPAAENAIWHGLQPSLRADKTIRLSIRKIADSHLRISLTDNGIGRKKANETKSHEHYERVSLGYEITMRRLELFNRTNREQIHLHITDLLYDSGTEVIFDYYT